MVLLLIHTAKCFNPRSREGSDQVDSPTKMTESVSIHAPAKGATTDHMTQNMYIVSFNPRSREGSDKDGMYVIENHVVVSIHAPAKGATFARQFKKILKLFQSTLPRRERQG